MAKIQIHAGSGHSQRQTHKTPASGQDSGKRGWAFGWICNILFFKGSESERISKAKQNKKPTTKNTTKLQAVIEKVLKKQKVTGALGSGVFWHRSALSVGSTWASANRKHFLYFVFFKSNNHILKRGRRKQLAFWRAILCYYLVRRFSNKVKVLLKTSKQLIFQLRAAKDCSCCIMWKLRGLELYL